MRVDVAGGDGDALGQARQLGHLLRQAADLRAEREDGGAHLLLEDAAETGLDGLEVLEGGVLPVLEHALVAGVAGGLGQGPGQLPGEPVEEVAHDVGLFIDLGRHLEDLEDLRQEQLGGEHPAVAAEPLLAARLGDLHQPRGLILGAVVLPQLDVGVDVVLKTGLLAQRHAVLVGEEHRRRRRVDADAHDVGRVHPGGLDRGGDRLAQHLDVIGRVLQRKLRREGLIVAGGQGAVHDAVRVFGHVRAELLAGRGVHDDGAAGKRSVVDADDVFLIGHIVFSLV